MKSEGFFSAGLFRPLRNGSVTVYLSNETITKSFRFARIGKIRLLRVDRISSPRNLANSFQSISRVFFLSFSPPHSSAVLRKFQLGREQRTIARASYHLYLNSVKHLSPGEENPFLSANAISLPPSPSGKNLRAKRQKRISRDGKGGFTFFFLLSLGDSIFTSVRIYRSPSQGKGEPESS